MFTLESGWWHNMHVTNSLFFNTFIYGYIPNAPDGVNGGTISIAPIDSGALGGGFGFVPDWSPQDGVADFTEQQRHILFANNNYKLDQWLIDWMGYGPNGSPYSKSKHQQRLDDEVPAPQPMFNGLTNTFFDSVDAQGNKAWPYINRAHCDSLNDPGLIKQPINLDSLKTSMDMESLFWICSDMASYGRFILYKHGGNNCCNGWVPIRGPLSLVEPSIETWRH
jgi:hypothetical protein